MPIQDPAPMPQNFFTIINYDQSLPMPCTAARQKMNSDERTGGSLHKYDSLATSCATATGHCVQHIWALRSEETQNKYLLENFYLFVLSWSHTISPRLYYLCDTNHSIRPDYLGLYPSVLACWKKWKLNTHLFFLPLRVTHAHLCVSVLYS